MKHTGWYEIVIRGNDEYEFTLLHPSTNFDAVVYHCNIILIPSLSKTTIEQLRIVSITELKGYK